MMKMATSHEIETKTETLTLGLIKSRPRPRPYYEVSRDQDFYETYILSLGGTETGTKTTKVSVPRVSAPRPPISARLSFRPWP